MNREKYLDRIKYTGSIEPDLDSLRSLQKHHLLYVPFENLDIYNKIPIELNIDKIFKKIVERKRGGFCYELNGLFFELLISLKFKAKRISARVYDNDNGYGFEFDHIAIIVEIENAQYLCDVGFGEFSFEPLKLEIGKIQYDERGNFLIDRYDDKYYRVNKIETKELRPEYIFQDIERKLDDFQEMCIYHQTSSDSHFTGNRLISRPSRNGRITITGNTLKVKESDSIVETEIKNETEFRQKLRDLFDIMD